MDANVKQLGENTFAVTFGVDPDESFRAILKALALDEHDAYGTIEGDNGEQESLYEAWLAGNYYGCMSCQAAFIARAALERKNWFWRPGHSPDDLSADLK